jgi:transposase-like protein
MLTCPDCHRPATKRDGYDACARQRYTCRPGHRHFTAHSTSAFTGHRWPPDVILRATRWYCRLPLSAAQVMRLVAERNIDISARTVLNWAQTLEG